MKVIDGRGMHTKDTAKKNKIAIRNFFNKNPGSTIKDCSDKLKLSRVTVSKHLNDLLKNES